MSKSAAPRRTLLPFGQHPPHLCRLRPEVMASEVWRSSLSPRLLPGSPLLFKPSPPPSSSSSSSCFRRSSLSAASLGLPSHQRRRVLVLRPRAADQQGQVQDGEVIDSKILPYCSLDKKAEKKTLGELEQEFLEALQSFYYDKKAIMSNEEFDNLKEELMWEGSSVVMLSPDEQKLLEASMAYAAGNPIMTDAEFDKLKSRLRASPRHAVHKLLAGWMANYRLHGRSPHLFDIFYLLLIRKEGSGIVQEGPRCSLRTKKVYSDLTVDYFKMFLLNVPAAVIALTLFFFLDDLTGFEITHLLELPEPFSFIFTWFAALPFIFWLAQSLTNVVVKDFLILKGPCPNCGTENVSFFGSILSIPSGGSANTVKCSNCSTKLVYDSGTRLITLPEPTEA